MSEPHLFLFLAAAMFAVGAMGLAMRRNPLVMFMALELMLNAGNLAFLTFTRYPVVPTSPGHGPAMVFVVMTVAAAEAVVGLAIIITIFRRRHDVDVDDLRSLRG